MFNNFFSENLAIYGILWKARHTTDDKITRRMCIAWWIPKATDTHSQYLIQFNSTYPD